MEEMETNDLLDDVQISDQREGRDRSLSPNSKKCLDHLIKDMKSKKASIHCDDKGHISVDYKSEMKDVMARKDISQTGKIVSPKNKDEVLAYVEAFSEIIAKMKELKCPGGINFSTDQICSKNGFYLEDKDFKKTKEILGKGLNGGIFVVKDHKTETEHALKTILIAEYHEEELRMWIDLNEEDFVPSLLMFRPEKDKIHFHMEKLTEVITLRKVIDDLMSKLDPDKIKGVSLCVLHGLLTAVNKIHGTKWTHNDLHAGNVMVQKNDLSIDVKIIDFGLGQRIEGMTTETEKGYYQSDLWSCFRLFSAMYIGQEFNDMEDVQKNGLDKLTKICEEYNFSEDDRKEILQLYDVFLEITSRNNQKFGETKKALKTVEDHLEKHDLNKEELLEHAALKLFPDRLTPLNSMDLDDFTDSPREGGPEDTSEKNLPPNQGTYRESCLFKAAGPKDAGGQDTDKIDSIGSTNSDNAEIMREILNEMSIRPRRNR